MNAALELQKAIFAALEGDAALEAALGGAKVYDLAPANAQFPYVTFGTTSLYDWSTATEDGTEQLFTLHVWSKGKGKRQVLELMEIVRARLHEADLALAGYQLVNLRQDFADVRYDDDISVHHGLMRFRAVVEAV